MVRWSCICCVFLLFTEIKTTLLQQFLDKFQNAFRDGDQRLSLSVTNNPLAPTGLSLLLLHVWRFSDTGCDHITCPTSGRHVREPFGKCLVHLANRVPKPGDGCTFGRTLPKRQLGGDTASDPPRATPNKALQPMGPICAKLCYGCENGHLSASQRTGGEQEMRWRFWPVRKAPR